MGYMSCLCWYFPLSRLLTPESLSFYHTKRASYNGSDQQSSSQKSIGFASGIAPSKVIDTYGVAKVVASGNPKFEKDDLVVGLITWGEYSVLKEGTILNKLDPMGFPLTYHVGILGFSGLAAYGGFFEVCKPKKGEKVFVSAASGSVGNMVEQYAKQLGCYVVGCAGTKQKVELLKEKLGFDDAFNYREETNLQSALKRYFPDGIDIYFDNVGGEMLGAAVDNALEDITSGVENIPSAFIGLFRGDNIGKKIVKLADE
ncbi:hypothetical protein CMV_023759 [Castanea mollissima]|uniref:Alcohol dehydrogenase-like C-terminal domain-containing protein n=1 Tax=Castanea mollissima TaxID=60419 RepID=A0A8J4QNY4_9ROSI|nr:hypothetical protein CMV_023759 [Castanea mollissima]